MTLPPRRTDRYTDRVDPTDDPASEFAGLYTNSAPESMAPPRVVSRSADRVGRVSPKRLQRIHAGLSDRDRAILDDLAKFHFLTSHHIELLHFLGHASSSSGGRVCRRTLKRLADLRVIEPLTRRIGGVRAGSAGYVWRLSSVGRRLPLASAELGRSRLREPSLRFLDHMLAVADCYVALKVANYRSGLALLACDPEPDSWRSFTGLSGGREILKPDLAAVTATPEFEDHWFCEIDRATEHLPTVIKKCRQYQLYRQFGPESVAGGVFPRVVWVVPDERRADELRRALSGSRDIDRALFRVTTHDGFLDVIREGAA